MVVIRYNQCFIISDAFTMTMFTGSLVAIVTPMHADGSLDIAGLRKLIDWHIAEGTDGIVIAGTTGESSTVTVEEHKELIRVTVEHAGGRIPIIAGSGGNSTQEAINLTQYAKSVGADGSLQVVPYYNRPTQEGMFQHFKKIAESVDIPIILYNVPGRTVADMSNETIARLTQVPNIVGVKEASGNIGRDIELLSMVPADFAVYSGDDLSAMALMLCGGQGNISVTANIAPRAMHELCVAAMAGDIARAKAINTPLIALHQKLCLEPNPVPVKWALCAMGMIPSGIRLPLVTHSEQFHESLASALREAGFLK